MLLLAPALVSALLIAGPIPIARVPRAAVVLQQFGQQYVEAIYESPADGQAGDLAFVAGDVIAIVQAGADGWWEGSLNGVTGWFPSTFCSTPWYDHGVGGGGTIQERIRARMVAAMKTGAVGMQEVVALRQIIAACTHMRQGMGLDVLHDEGAIEALSELAGSLPRSETFLLGIINEYLPASLESPAMRAAARYEYAAGRPDELSLQPGDILEVLDAADPDWWTGSLRGQTGVFPAKYVDIIESDEYLAC